MGGLYDAATLHALLVFAKLSNVEKTYAVLQSKPTCDKLTEFAKRNREHEAKSRAKANPCVSKGLARKAAKPRRAKKRPKKNEKQQKPKEEEIRKKARAKPNPCVSKGLARKAAKRRNHEGRKNDLKSCWGNSWP